MNARVRLLAAIGLQVHDELLIKSLTQVTKTRTTEAWTFHEGLEADVVLCNPDSALAVAALRRAGSAKTTVHVSVVHEGVIALPDTLTLRAPIRSSEFIALLNHISGLRPANAASVGREVPRSIVPNQRARPAPLASAVLELIRAKLPDPYNIESMGLSVLLLPSTRMLFAPETLGELELQQLANPASARLVQTDADAWARATREWQPLRADDLLWRIGLGADEGSLLPQLPVDARFSLRRWPDFGKLRHEPFHFSMTALLIRRPHSVDELAQASARTFAETCAFIHACAMCDLLDVHPASGSAQAMTGTTTVASTPSPRSGRYATLFRSLRSALGMKA